MLVFYFKNITYGSLTTFLFAKEEKKKKCKTSNNFEFCFNISHSSLKTCNFSSFFFVVAPQRENKTFHFRWKSRHSIAVLKDSGFLIVGFLKVSPFHQLQECDSTWLGGRFLAKGVQKQKCSHKTKHVNFHSPSHSFFWEWLFWAGSFYTFAFWL